MTGLIMLAGCASEQPPAYHATELVTGVSMHGVNGMAFHPDGTLYAGSVIGQAIYRIDVTSGAVTTVVAAPDGEADDVAFAPDGTLAWTALIAGELRAQRPGGLPFVVADNLPRINPVAFDRTGRLFAGRMQYDDLFEFDLDGTAAPRLIAQGLGQLNGFEIGPDGKLYGPLPARGAVARIDIDSGAVEILADGLGQVVGVDMDSQGNVYAVNWESGEIFRLDSNGAVTTLARLEPPLDNLVVGPDDRVYTSQPSRNAVLVVEPNGDSHTVVSSTLAAPGGLALLERGGEPALLITDAFGYRFVDPTTGALLAPPADRSGGSTDVAVGADLIALSYVRRGQVSVLDRATLVILKTWPDIQTPYGILLRDERMVVAEFASGQLLQLSMDSDEREVLASGLDGPVGLAWADTQSVYVSEALSGQVQRVLLSDGSKELIVTGLEQPEGLAVLPDGGLVIAEAGAGRVTLVDPISGERRMIGDGLALGSRVSRAPDPVYLPTGIAVDGDGAIYVTEDRTNGVRKLTPVPSQ